MADLQRRLAELLNPDDPDRVLRDDDVMGLFSFGLAEARFATGCYDEAASWARLSLGRMRSSIPGHAVLAASYGHLGQSDEARRALVQLLENWPGFSLGHIKLLFGRRTRDFWERLREGLRMAGLP